MKSMRFRFSLFTLMLVIALAGVGTMLYQRHIEWQKAEQEFTLIIESLPRPPDHVSRVSELVSRYPELAQRPGAISYAANTDNNDLCRQFLAAGADPNDPQSGKDHAPLFRPLTIDNVELVELLIAHGAELKVRSENFDPKRTLLHLAAAWESPNVCRVLIQHGLDVNDVDSEESTPLHDAADTANIEVIKVLLAHGAQCKKNKNGQTPRDIAKAGLFLFKHKPNELQEYVKLLAQLKELEESNHVAN